jgi:hypothetical protein
MFSAWPHISSSAWYEVSRMHDLHHLDFIELMLAYHSARIATVAAGFRTEARRMRSHFDRQGIDGKNFVTHDIRQRHFGSRDQIQGFALAFLAAFLDGEQIGFELRQLTGALQRSSVHDIRRIAFGITVFCGMRVEHELRKRAMQTRNAAFHDRETRAGQLGRDVKIQAQCSTYINVIA